MNYDIFNGDADGIIALLQLRLATPLEADLITGVKRDIALVKKVQGTKGDNVTVLDISMEKNQQALQANLENGAKVFYADHHRCGEIPEHENLQANIDLDANTCTALIIDKLLNGQFHDWAIVAAFGDNLTQRATDLAVHAGHDKKQIEQLQELGVLVNYNGYGSEIADLHYHPADLYKLLLQYPSPFDVIADLHSPFYKLQTAYQSDMDNALAIKAKHQSDILSVFELKNEKWAKRISGVYGNYLANQNPDSAFAVLTQNSDGSYLVSLRAPLNNKKGAGDICSQFNTGGGRAAAAGINQLALNELSRFINLVEKTYA